MAQLGLVSIVTARPGATAGYVWSAALLKGAPGLLEEVVKTFVAAVHGLTSAFHGGLDVLDREQGCAAPVRSLRLFFSHDREVPRCLARASHTMADIYLQAREQLWTSQGRSGQTVGACLAAPSGPLQAMTRLGGEAVSRRFAIGPSGRLLEMASRGLQGSLVEVGRPSGRAGRRGASPGARCFWALGGWSLRLERRGSSVANGRTGPRVAGGGSRVCAGFSAWRGGIDLGNPTEAALRDRREVSVRRILFVVVTVSADDAETLTDHEIVLRGIPLTEAENAFVNAVRKLVEKSVERASDIDIHEAELAQQVLHDAFAELVHKRPAGAR